MIYQFNNKIIKSVPNNTSNTWDCKECLFAGQICTMRISLLYCEFGYHFESAKSNIFTL